LEMLRIQVNDPEQKMISLWWPPKLREDVGSMKFKD